MFSIFCRKEAFGQAALEGKKEVRSLCESLFLKFLTNGLLVVGGRVKVSNIEAGWSAPMPYNKKLQFAKV